MLTPTCASAVCMQRMTLVAGVEDAAAAVTDPTVTTDGGGGARGVVSRSLAGLNPFRQRNGRNGQINNGSSSSSSDATLDSDSNAIAGTLQCLQLKLVSCISVSVVVAAL
jgi:hypothetical protein